MTERSLSLRHPGDPSYGVYPLIAAGHRPAWRAADPKGFPGALLALTAVLVAFAYTILALSELVVPLFIIIIIIIVMTSWRLFPLRERGAATPNQRGNEHDERPAAVAGGGGQCVEDQGIPGRPPGP